MARVADGDFAARVPGPQHRRARRAERALQPHGRRPAARGARARALRPLREPGRRAAKRSSAASRSAASSCRRPRCSSTCAASPRSRRAWRAAQVVDAAERVLRDRASASAERRAASSRSSSATAWSSFSAARCRRSPDHARPRAAAIALQRALARDADRRRPVLEAGIGICTGDMIAGNVGAGEPRDLHDRRRRREPGRAPAGEDPRPGAGS